MGQDHPIRHQHLYSSPCGINHTSCNSLTPSTPMPTSSKASSTIGQGYKYRTNEERIASRRAKDAERKKRKRQASQSSGRDSHASENSVSNRESPLPASILSQHQPSERVEFGNNSDEDSSTEGIVVVHTARRVTPALTYHIIDRVLNTHALFFPIGSQPRTSNVTGSTIQRWQQSLSLSSTVHASPVPNFEEAHIPTESSISQDFHSAVQDHVSEHESRRSESTTVEANSRISAVPLPSLVRYNPGVIHTAPVPDGLDTDGTSSEGDEDVLEEHFEIEQDNDDNISDGVEDINGLERELGGIGRRESAEERVTVDWLAQNLFQFQGCSAQLHEVPGGDDEIYLWDLIQFFEELIPLPANKDPVTEMFEDQDLRNVSDENWEWAYAGTNAEFPGGRRLSLEGSQVDQIPGYPPPLQATIVSFDIDSIICLPTSFAIARQGMTFNIAPVFSHNIQQDLHIELAVPYTEDGVARNLPVHKIPHFRLGKLIGPLNLDVFVLLPGLLSIEIDKATNFPTRNQLSRFMDQIFLPALYEECPPDMTQHIPGSYAEAEMRNTAFSTEARKKLTDTAGRSVVQTYMLPGKYAEGLWSRVISRCSMEGLRDYQDIIIMVNGKNFKTFLKGNSPQSCFREFLEKWNTQCDGDYLNPSATWIDYGKESIANFSLRNSSKAFPELDAVGGETYLWRTCCLETYIQNLRKAANLEQGGLRSALYPWALTQEAANLTVLTTGRNPMKTAGLVYSQFYTSSKEIFDAGKAFPFDNPGLEALAIDPRLRKAILKVDGHRNISGDVLRKAYKHSKQRALISLASSATKSYGVRLEHRVTLSLLKSLAIELSKPRWQSVTSRLAHPQLVNQSAYLRLSTPVVARYLRSNILKLCIPLEMILSRGSKDDMSWEDTKMAVCLLRAVKHAYRGGTPSHQAGLWQDKVDSKSSRDAGKPLYGLGWKKAIQDRGYAWFPKDRIQWGKWLFHPSISQRTFFNDNALLDSYRKRWRTVRSFSDMYREVDWVGRRLREASQLEDPLTMVLILRWMRWECIRQYRREVWQVLEKIIPLGEQHREQARLGNLPLCAQVFFGDNELTPNVFHFNLPYNRHKFDTSTVVQYIWGSEDGKNRTIWENKPYRQLFEHCKHIVKSELSRREAEKFQINVYREFLLSNWIFPQPWDREWMPREKGQFRMHNAVHGEYEQRYLKWVRESAVCDVAVPGPRLSQFGNWRPKDWVVRGDWSKRYEKGQEKFNGDPMWGMPDTGAVRTLDRVKQFLGRE